MIGIIGLGLVGSAICKRFHEKDFQVVGYDISPEAANQTKRFGVKISRSAEEVGLLADIVILSLPDSTQVDLVVEGPKGLLKTIAKNSLIIDTTTTDPQASEKTLYTIRGCLHYRIQQRN